MSAQVRRIAILVTSLDSAAGRQLLLAMPSQLARDVRKAMASLTSIDPAEQRQVLAEFRNQAISSTAGASNAGTSANAAAAPMSRPSAASAAEQPLPRTAGETGGPADQVDAVDDELANAASDPARPWAQLDVAALTDLLRGERPLVIAVMLSQLQPRHAARLLEQFPRPQHRAVLAHLAHLGDIDPEAMRAIDDHLASRIADYHHRRDSQSESASRMQELLAAASPELRGHWQGIIAESDQQLAKRLGIEVPAQATASPAADAARPVARGAAAGHGTRSSLIDMLANNVMTTADAQIQPSRQRFEAPHTENDSPDSEPVVLPFPGAAGTHAHLAAQSQAANQSAKEAAKDSVRAIATLDQVLELPPRTIARVLAAADGQVLLLALAGASPGFMQRFTTMLEKQDARALQARLGQLGAINLQDVDEAQRRLCELASHIVGQMQFRRAAPEAARAAA